MVLLLVSCSASRDHTTGGIENLSHMAAADTPPQSDPFCFSGGVIIGSQPLNATWSETKRQGGGYAISINGKGAVVERVRIHNHHDGLMPYRSDGFVLRDSWLSHIRGLVVTQLSLALTGWHG